SSDLFDEGGQPGGADSGGGVGAAAVVGPQHVEELAHLGEGLARGLLGAFQRLAGDVLAGRQGGARAADECVDDAQVVGDDVVQLAGDAPALGPYGRVGRFLPGLFLEFGPDADELADPCGDGEGEHRGQPETLGIGIRAQPGRDLERGRVHGGAGDGDEGDLPPFRVPAEAVQADGQERVAGGAGERGGDDLQPEQQDDGEDRPLPPDQQGEDAEQVDQGEADDGAGDQGGDAGYEAGQAEDDDQGDVEDLQAPEEAP